VPDAREQTLAHLRLVTCHAGFWELRALHRRKVLESVAPDKLWLAPDCGFSQTARVLTVDKLKSLVDAAGVIRTELAG
jgi:hypothetical protein